MITHLNQRVTGKCGGIIFDPKGQTKNSFKLGLGEASNNQAKDLVLLQGLNILHSNRIRDLIQVFIRWYMMNLLFKTKTHIAKSQ